MSCGCLSNFCMGDCEWSQRIEDPEVDKKIRALEAKLTQKEREFEACKQMLADAEGRLALERQVNEVLEEVRARYGNEESWRDISFERNEQIDGVDDPYCRSISDDDMEDMSGYHVGGLHARAAQRRVEEIRRGK